jgi:hypothetical protein
MFDSSAQIKMPAPYRMGDQKLTVRWPTDDEWAKRNRAKKFITRRLGRGKSETIPPEPGETDLQLYEAISLNGSPPVSVAEASMILDALAQCNVLSVQIEEGMGVIEMDTMAGLVTHRLKIPTAELILSWRRTALRVVELANNQSEMRFNPQAGATGWDGCGGVSTDYAAAVPAIHKDIAFRALVDFIDQNMGPRIDDPNS